MLSTQLNQHIFLVDLKPAGFSHFIASYIIKVKKVAIIEAGPSTTVPNLLAGLRETQIPAEAVNYVALTHIHLDHGGGAGLLLHHLPNAKLIVHKRGAPHIINPDKLWTQAKQVLGETAELYEKPMPVPKERVIVADDGMKFALGEGLELMAIETLGHASHHQSFYEKTNEAIFPGDAAGIYMPKLKAIVPTTPSPFQLETALSSIDKMKQLKPSMLYYSHFGQANDAIKKLQVHANQLNLWAKIIAEGIEKDVDVEELKHEIEQQDPLMHITREYIKTHPIMRKGSISRSIHGFIEYFKKKKRKH